MSGNIVDVAAKRIFQGTISIEGERIAEVSECPVDSDQFIIPGFIDAHVHVESSMLIPSEFARLAVCHGTVGTISDPHEIANVLGIDGVRFMIENAREVPFKFCFGAPSCVPATPFETAGAELDVEAVAELLALPEIGYLAEMMNFPGVLEKHEIPLAKIALAREAGKPVDGHAPGLRGEDARTYANAGISTDHECFTADEALDKLKFGMKILIREGSAAKNFDALICLLEDFPDEIMFCSDDKHPNDLVVGHINHLARRAVASGCDPMNVLRACSYNVIQHYKLNAGLLQPGDPADFAIVSDLENFEVDRTFINGRLVAENGKSKIDRVAVDRVNHFHRTSIERSDIQIEAESETVNVIEVTDGQLITKRITAQPRLTGGKLESCPESDVLKIVVANRYENTKPAVGFVRNFGLKRGAIASTVAHDSHNIIATGVSDDDLIDAINSVIACKGGISLAHDSKTKTLELPVAGLMTDQCGYATAEAYEELDRAAKDLGSTLESPYMTLSFCALLVIPELKLGDRGLFDGNRFQFRTLFE